MIFTETNLKGAFLVEPEKIEDERGFFARTWDLEEFRAHGLNSRLAQCSVSFNGREATLRGMHYQAAPHCGDQADSLHGGCDLRRHRRPQTRLAYLQGVDGRGVDGREYAYALRTRGVCPWFPDP